MASVTAIFHELLTSLAEQSALAADAERLTDRRRWFIPPGGSWTSVLDVANLQQSFDRTEPDDDYVAALDEKGTLADAIAAKRQADYVAAAERAFRTRHRSPIRARAHVAARERGHGDGQGVFLGSVLGYVQNVIARGQ